MSATELRRASGILAAAEVTAEPLGRFGQALAAAQVIAAFVLRVRVACVRPAERNVWQLLVTVAPELGEWAGFFATCQAKQQLAAAGARGVVGSRDADDLVRDVRCFHDAVLAWQTRCLAHRAQQGPRAGASA